MYSAKECFIESCGELGKGFQQGSKWLCITLALAGSLELIEGRMQEPRHPYEVEGL